VKDPSGWSCLRSWDGLKFSATRFRRGAWWMGLIPGIPDWAFFAHFGRFHRAKTAPCLIARDQRVWRDELPVYWLGISRAACKAMKVELARGVRMDMRGELPTFAGWRVTALRRQRGKDFRNLFPTAVFHADRAAAGLELLPVGWDRRSRPFSTT